MVRYVVNVNKTELKFSPEEIGSIIIKFLKNVAERNLTAPVTKCVMSVPAEFDDTQRNYTKKAGSIAGKILLQKELLHVPHSLKS